MIKKGLYREVSLSSDQKEKPMSGRFMLQANRKTVAEGQGLEHDWSADTFTFKVLFK